MAAKVVALRSATVTIDDALYEKALEIQKVKLGHDHPQTLTTQADLAFAAQGLGRLDRALPLFEQTLMLQTAKLGADHPHTLTTLCNVAWCYRDLGDLSRALPLFQQSVTGVEKQGFTHAYSGRIVGSLSDCLERMKQFDQAETWRRKWLAVVKERSGAESTDYVNELMWLGRNLSSQKRFADAEPILSECLAQREKKEPDAWTTFYTKSLLGGAFLGQRKYVEAEVLLNGYQGMKQREAKIPGKFRAQLMSEALGRLVEFYTETNKPEEVKKWQAEKDKLSVFGQK